MSLIKIFFVLPSLKAGGAERVLSYLARKIDKEKYEVKLIIIGREESVAYKYDPSATIFLNQDRVLNAIYPLWKLIRKEKPAIVFSSIIHLNSIIGLISLLFFKTKFIAREASVFSEMSQFSSISKAKGKFLVRMIYPLFDKIVCQSQDMKRDFVETFHFSEDQLIVINNPITQTKLNSTEIEESEIRKKVRFITVGRLEKVKGIERILANLAKIKSYSYEYVLIGSGQLEESILSLIDELGLKEKVIHIPFTNEVIKELRASDCFLQGSYVEGFPNALLESCSVGTPVIAFNAPGGTKEIIESGINGYIVETEDEFFNIIQSRAFLKKFDRAIVKQTVEDKFSAKVILNKYERLFDDLVN